MITTTETILPENDDTQTAALRVKAAADLLWNNRRSRWQRLPQALYPQSLGEAYAIQYLLRSRFADIRGDIVGWKIALASPITRAMLGLSEPLFGTIYSATSQNSPARVRALDHWQLSVEGSIAFQIGRDLPGREQPYRRDAIAKVIIGAAPALDLADHRGGSDVSIAGPNQFVAENAWSTGIVLGQLTGI
jgi:2-keto-4-pentenoate hydratase